jgi:hypothetical protein
MFEGKFTDLRFILIFILRIPYTKNLSWVHLQLEPQLTEYDYNNMQYIIYFVGLSEVIR